MVAQIGEANRNQQRLVQKTSERGTDYNQYVWVLICQRESAKHAGICGHQYGANGSDFHERKCPICQGGADGLPLPSVDRRCPDA
jgi:hypothetical protein